MALMLLLIWALGWGFITSIVSSNKGYDGGFWWGFFLGFIGLIVVACRPENKESSYNDGTSQEFLCQKQKRTEEAVSETKKELDTSREKAAWLGDNFDNGMLSGTDYARMSNYLKSSINTKEKNLGKLKEQAEQLKKESETKEKEATEAKAKEEARENAESELLNIQRLKAYKDLLDSGVISQEEFDKKKTELLNL